MIDKAILSYRRISCCIGPLTGEYAFNTSTCLSHCGTAPKGNSGVTRSQDGGQKSSAYVFSYFVALFC